MRDFELELGQSLKKIREDVEKMKKNNKELSDILYNIESKATMDYYCDDDAFDKAFDESLDKIKIDEIKQLIKKYDKTKVINFYRDIDGWTARINSTNCEAIEFSEKSRVGVEDRCIKFMQIDKAIRQIVSIGIDNHVELCYDMYKAIEILIKERDRILHNYIRVENPARKVSVGKLPMAYKR
jgi:DNA repair ATPase RecN